MDNRELIKRLIGFDDETDTSTGYVGVGETARVFVRDPKEERAVIRRAKGTCEEDGYDQIVYVDKNGTYCFSRLYTGWYEHNSWDCIKVIAVVVHRYRQQPTVLKTFTKSEIPDKGLYVVLVSRGFPKSDLKELIDWPYPIE